MQKAIFSSFGQVYVFKILKIGVHLRPKWKFLYYRLSSPAARIEPAPEKTMRSNPQLLKLTSGWADLNRRPHGPKPCALTRLRYTPLISY